MPCPAVITGPTFVTRVLTHIDCQTEYLGSYSYQSLAQANSPAGLLVLGLLTLYIALWGYRLLFGPRPPMRDVMTGAMKVGVVLTIAFSWPAFRTVIHNTVLNGPAQIASSLTTPGLPNSGTGFVDRLQAADNAMDTLTHLGTGRRTGQYIDPNAPGGTFRSAPLDDEGSFGFARVAYLAGLIGTLAIVRLGAGLLLALAPLAAGILLFPATRGLFMGWLRGLAFAFVAAIGMTLTFGVELAVLEPWLADTLVVRQQGYATPTAPTELLTMALGFTLIHLGVMWGAARVAFFSEWSRRVDPAEEQTVARYSEGTRVRTYAIGSDGPSRAEALSRRIEARMRVEQEAGYSARAPVGAGFAVRPNGKEPVLTGLAASDDGTVTRRTSSSASRSSVRRDVSS